MEASVAESEPSSQTLAPRAESGDLLNCLSQTRVCEFRSLSASQIGAVVAAVLSAVVLLMQWHPRHKGEPLALQYCVIFGLTAIYYLINELAIEETKVAQLRSLKYGLQHVEFWIRVGIVVGLAFAAEPLLDPSDARADIGRSILILKGIYGAFLVWDLVVVLGGQRRVLGIIWMGDVAGLLVTGLSPYWRNTDWEGVLLLLLGGCLLFFSKSSFPTAWKRLTALIDRSRLR